MALVSKNYKTALRALQCRQWLYLILPLWGLDLPLRLEGCLQLPFYAPLAFVTSHESTQYLFWRGFFDEQLDEYSSDYKLVLYGWPGSVLTISEDAGLKQD